MRSCLVVVATAFHRMSLVFVRLGMAAVAFLFIGGFGFAAGGILSALLVGILFASFTASGPMDALNSAYASHPWGLAAWLVTTGECTTLFVAAWLAWRLTARLFEALPAAARKFAPVSFGAFLLIEVPFNALSLPPAIELAREYQVTTGQIREVHLENHGTVTYTYTVNGRRYDAGGSPEKPEELQPGSPIQVYYLPSEPTLKSLHKPQGEVLNTFFGIFVFGTFVCIAPLGLAAVRSLAEAHSSRSAN